MSLINQMLKELDARRSDGGGAAPFGGQVRAVPDRRTVHPAWWLALALGISLLAVLAWVLLRPPVADPYLVRAQLPLKLEVDLGAVVEAAPLAPATPISSADPEPAVASAVPTPVPTPNPANFPADPVVTPLAALPELASLAPPAPAVMPAPPVRVPVTPVARQAPAPVAAVEVDDASPSPPITKQVRELTAQQRAENEFRKATLAMQQGRKPEAQAGFETALALDAGHAGARQALIAVLIDGGRTDDAMRHAREGLNKDARQAGLAMILARLQLEKNDLRGALETLERARPAAGDRADYVAFHAALLQRDARHKEAVEQYLVALRKVPQNGLWWMGLGISLQAEQRNGEAQEAFKRAKASNALSPELAAFVDSRLAQLK